MGLLDNVNLNYSEPGCEPRCRKEFTEGLVGIAGLNPHNQPILRCVDGHTARKLEGGRYILRYAKTIEYSLMGEVEIGEPYFYIERWRDPEFLASSGRFRFQRDDGTTITFLECRNCGKEVPSAAETMNWDVQRICLSCGSKRISPKDIRVEGEGKLIQDLPPEGYYDYYAKLEKKDGSFHDADNEALMVINAMWVYEHTFSLKERNQHALEDRRPRLNPSLTAQVFSR